MISVKAVKSDGTEWHAADLYACTFSYQLKVGCSSAEVTVPYSADLPDRLWRLEIWDDLTRIWVGRLEDTPAITESGEVVITAIGYGSALKDREVKYLYSDTSYGEWGSALVNSSNSTVEKFTPDNDNRVFIKEEKGNTYSVGQEGNMFYGRTYSAKINQAPYSVSWTYATGAGYNATYGKLYLTSTTETNVLSAGAVNEWSLAGTGALSGSTSHTITAGNKGLFFRYFVHTAGAPSSESNWVKLTSVRVNGSSAFVASSSYHGDAVVKHQLKNYVPSASTDYSKIIAGNTTVLTDFVVDSPTTPSDVIDMALAAEDVDYGFYELDSAGKPMFQVTSTNRSLVDWTVSQDNAKLTLAGRSVAEMYNQVVVEYQTQDGQATSLTRTYSDAGLTDPFSGNLTREARIRVDTTSQTTAQDSGDAFLAEYTRDRGKGEAVLSGLHDHRSKGRLNAWHMRPGETVYFQDLDSNPDTLGDLASSDVLNGRNVFRIIDVSVDAASETTHIQLDAYADKLEFSEVA